MPIQPIQVEVTNFSRSFDPGTWYVETACWLFSKCFCFLATDYIATRKITFWLARFRKALSICILDI